MVDANANISGEPEPIVLDPDLVDAVRSEIYLWLNEDSADRDLAKTIIAIVRGYDAAVQLLDPPLTDLDRRVMADWDSRGITRIENTPEFMKNAQNRFDKILQGLNDRLTSKRDIVHRKT